MHARIIMVVILGLSTAIVSSSPTKASTKQSPLKNDKEKAERGVDLDPVADASSDYEDEFFVDDSQNYRQHRPSSSVEIDHSIELEGGSQNFFPAWANLFRQQPLGHSRPLAYQEGAYSQRPNPLKQLLNYNQGHNGYRNNDYGKSIPASNDANSILGSGNFGVIRGGTFFSESSDTESQFSDGYDSSYNNGHGRPSFFYNNPRPNYNQDQFANFRDFADINAPSNQAFSHFVVVYANKNGTVVEAPKQAEEHLAAKPKNIMETLARIEEESAALPTEAPAKKSKISKGKLKLALLNQKKHIVKKMLKKSDEGPKDLDDPLLALS